MAHRSLEIVTHTHLTLPQLELTVGSVSAWPWTTRTFRAHAGSNYQEYTLGPNRCSFCCSYFSQSQSFCLLLGWLLG